MAVWPNPEMKKIVNGYGCGIVSKSFSLYEMADRLNSLTAHEIYRYKKNCHEAAKELCAEKNREKFLAIIEGVS